MSDRRKEIEERIRCLDREMKESVFDFTRILILNERRRLIAELTRLTAESAGLAREES
jgi:hypothetical protein